MARRRHAFTLIELLIVMVIIGILIALILKAMMGGVRAAEEKATIALVAKLEQAMTDRVDALTTYRAEPTPWHHRLASLYNPNAAYDDYAYKAIANPQRAQAIAQFDFIRAQMPDVFVVMSDSPSITAGGDYPINFAGISFGGKSTLPLGADNGANGTITGMFGAAFEVAGGIYKQLGYHPNGYDGSDNDGDGFTDDSFEGLKDLPAADQAMVRARLGKHTHKTARSEMLYALLVEGGGVYGSSFDKDDFTSKEVQDTDGDGLMEFVDAWGEPLQFYRWPILYRSDAQKGFPDVAKLMLDVNASNKPGPYSSVYEAREQNPIDPNQTLLDPAWWGSGFNSGAKPSEFAANSGAISGQAMTFMRYFGPCLVDPTALAAGAPSANTFWDRSDDPNPKTTGPIYARRAFYSRFLILSGGPDRMPGTAQLLVNYRGIDDRSSIETPTGSISGPRDASGAAVGFSVPALLLESQGGKVDLNRDSLGKLSVFAANGRNDTNSQLEFYSQDDISSHNLQGIGGALQ